MAAIAQWKKDIVKELKEKIESYPTVAVIDMTNLPAQQLQIMRHKLRGKADIQMSRKRLLVRAIKESNRKDSEKLIEYIKGLPALLFSKENAFELFKILKRNMSEAPAKSGQTAPRDIIIKAGSTEFLAGPVISELQKLGIKSGIEKGKVVIKEDKVLVKEGEELNKEQAGILSRLGMKPMKIGINLLSALEKQELFPREALDIDIDDYKKRIQKAYEDTFKLSVALGFVTKENVKFLVQKAHSDVKKLALGAEIMTDETKDELMKKAEAQATALKEKVGDIKAEEAPEEEKKEEVKEGEKTEEKVPEEKETENHAHAKNEGEKGE